MKTETKKENVMDPGLISGRWKLTYRLTNNLGVNGFSGRLISSYTCPHTGRGRHLKDPDGVELPGFFIDRPEIIFDPERNKKDMLSIDWLVGHPSVGIDNDHCKLHRDFINKKEKNPRILLVNLDYQAVEDLEEEDYIDKLVGRISMDSGVHAISLEKLQWILAQLKLQYRDQRYLKNKDVLKKRLRKTLKDFIRQGMSNAEEVNAILDNLELAKFEFQIRELIRLEIITVSRGTYMYNGSPLGISKESVLNFFNNDPEFYVEIEKELYERLAEEENSSR